MTESQFIETEARKHADKLRRQLTRVQQTGFPSSRNVCETLLVNDMIHFGGPSDTNMFNHYRLTERAAKFLESGTL